MRGFRFRLETALRLRCLAEQEAQAALAAAERERIAVEARREALGAERARHLTALAPPPGHPIAMDLLTAGARYALALDLDLDTQRAAVDTAMTVCAARREELAHRRQEREALERLREQRRAQYQFAAAAAEQAELDEMAVRRWGQA